jgi:hydrogenase maturation factor
VSGRPGAEGHESSVAAAAALGPAALMLARRFADGATMWCVAPGWAAHGRHVAVEFVHPVVMGTRALPALFVDTGGSAESLRLLVRSGDVLLGVGSAADPHLADLLARSGPWGLTSIWLGAGPPPDRAAADHVVWLESTDATRASHSGDVVLLYHLLWELTHVVFEHPGLLRSEPECDAEVCITCSDEGRVAEVRVVHRDSVEVMTGGRVETVDATLVEPVSYGDLVLVHAGVALATLHPGSSVGGGGA